MSSVTVLDRVVEMIFIYLLARIICSSAVELWLSVRRTRAPVRQDFDSLRAAVPMNRDEARVTMTTLPIQFICPGAQFWFDIQNKISNLQGHRGKTFPYC